MFSHESENLYLKNIKKQLKFEKWLLFIGVGILFHFFGPAAAIIGGLMGIGLLLADIKQLLVHRNFMEERQVGLSELDKLVP